MHTTSLKNVGHQNRIFGMKCNPNDENMVATAGWDRAIKIYDIRANKVVASIGGPLIVGDSLDIFNDYIVTGSNRNKDVMQIFSISQ
jgi:WD40 repeat protein